MRSTCRSTKTQSSESEKVIRRWVIWDFSKPQVIQSLSAWQLWLCWLCISKQRERLGVYRFQQHSSTDPPTSIFIFRVRSGSASFWRVFSAPRTRDSVLAEEVDRSRFVTRQQFDRSFSCSDFSTLTFSPQRTLQKKKPTHMTLSDETLHRSEWQPFWHQMAFSCKQCGTGGKSCVNTTSKQMFISTKAETLMLHQ